MYYIYIVHLICQKGSTLHHAGRSWVCSAAAAGARTSTPLCASARKPGWRWAAWLCTSPQGQPWWRNEHKPPVTTILMNKHVSKFGMQDMELGQCPMDLPFRCVNRLLKGIVFGKTIVNRPISWGWFWFSHGQRSFEKSDYCTNHQKFPRAREPGKPNAINLASGDGSIPIRILMLGMVYGIMFATLHAIVAPRNFYRSWRDFDSWRSWWNNWIPEKQQVSQHLGMQLGLLQCL